VIIREVPDPELIDRLAQSSAPRSEGLHLSTIIKALMRRLQPKRFKHDTPMDTTRVEIGLVFENMLERGLAEKFGTVRPGEVFSDEGIAMSPDGLNPGDIALEEYKSTYMSSRDGLFEIVEMDGIEYQVVREKFLHWFYQMKGYCKWLGVRKAILRVLFICGDYSKPIQPQFKSYHIEFTDQEIEDNWRTLMRVAEEEGLA
jgi:hypothetical protein